MQNPVIKERPILFSTEMVQAILQGRKTQTRRVVKGIALKWLEVGFTNKFVSDMENRLSPYGQVGDRLWVRETHYAFGFWSCSIEDDKPEWSFNDCTLQSANQYHYENDKPTGIISKRVMDLAGWYKRPSIFMPRDASRITLEITNVRIEKLHDITDNDALAEGIWPLHYDTYHNLHKDLPFQDYREPKNSGQGLTPVYSYETLWQKINGPDSWDKNPYVWVIEFKVITL